MRSQLQDTTLLERNILLLGLYGYKMVVSDELIKSIFWISPELYTVGAQLSQLKKGIERSIKSLEKKGFLQKEKYKPHVLRSDINHWELLQSYLEEDKKLLKECQRVILNRRGEFFDETRFDETYTDCFFNVLRVSLLLGQIRSVFSRYSAALKVLDEDRLKKLTEDIHFAYQYFFIERSEKKGQSQINMQTAMLNLLLNQYIQTLSRPPEWFLEEIADPELKFGIEFDNILANRGLLLLLLGEWSRLELLLQSDKSVALLYIQGTLEIFKGHYDKGILTVHQAMKLLSEHKKFYPASNRYLQGTLPFFWFLVLHKNTESPIDIAAEYEYGLEHYEWNPSSMIPLAQEHIHTLALLHREENNLAIHHIKMLVPETPIDYLINTIFYHHLEIKVSDRRIKKLQNIYTNVQRKGFYWLQMELAYLLSLVLKDKAKKDHFEQSCNTISDQLGAVPLATLYKQKELWVSTLSKLAHFFESRKQRTTQVQVQHKLAVYVEFYSQIARLKLKIKKRRKNGSWTAGRKIEFNTTIKDKFQLTEKELRIISHYQEDDHSIYFNSAPSLKFQREVLNLLVGFDELYEYLNPTVKITLKKDEVKMLMTEEKDQINVRFNYFPQFEDSFEVFPTGQDEYTYVEFSEEQSEILSQFSHPNMSFPASVSEQVLEFTDKFASIFPLETLLLEEMDDLPRQEGDPTPQLHLSKDKNQFRVEWFVKPDPESTMLFHPTEGRKLYKIQDVNGNTVLLDRNIDKEGQAFNECLKELELPEEQKTSDYSWTLTNDEQCLDILLQIKALQAEERLVVTWPQGRQLSLAKTLDTRHLQFHIAKGKNYWFDVDAQVESDDKLAISFRQLLALTENSSRRYIQLTDQQFVGITESLRKQLDTARALLQKDKKDRFKMHAVSAAAMEELFEDAGTVSMDDYWQEAKEKFEKAQKIRPRIPKGFTANLRPYQKKGFKWMMQLAEWGVGGCLADDMGLGKTIQALAVLCARKNMGPALVVAPASVTHNWLRETEKFAPELNAQIFGSGDREEMLDNLGKGSLLICSYGLMYSEIDRLEKIHFQMALLDEAQAIKNFTTKRYKAAVRLNADFKMATTGTPVENHLGELWSLFNFLNPGMLGSSAHFRDKFAKAINSGDQKALHQLKKLVQPFILRRHKSKVLKDLPPKTEINYTVSLSKDEKALYEGMRRLSLDKIQQTIKQKQKGQSHITVLAELTKLRRACCHPSLANSKLKMKGSKMDAVKDLVSDLMENEHKVLIFSQFVDFLKIVRQWMDKNNIAYQYLDGSTSNKKREKAVNAFQNGQGDAFLISLKAGGVGLNLTEADYVLILDPWWNPAVESQAADRAHRMGQKKPVTVYRFVTENTIEEKIIKLHATKQELAESLLQGTDKASKITTSDLLELLHSDED